jgi:hypothetical protein
VRLEFLHGLWRVVEERETCALATTELSAETEDGHLVLRCLVELTELLAELILGDIGAGRVKNITVVL